MRLRSLAVMTSLGLGLAASPALALTINYATFSGDTLTTQQADAFAVAASAWEAAVINPVTITIDIGFTSSIGDGSALAGAAPEEYYVGYSSMKAALAADITSTAQATSVANLPASVPGGNVVGTAADLMALGWSAGSLASGNYAGDIQFSNSFIFQYSRNGDGTVNGGYYDFLGIAEHEIGHILGFISDVGTGISYNTVLDLDRYSAPGTPSFTVGQAAYLSVDGGTTDIAGFSDGSTYQASHWLNGSGLLMQPAIGTGQTQNITPTDLEAMNVIGWDLNVPEPGSLALLGSALAGLLAIRRRGVRSAEARR